MPDGDATNPGGPIDPQGEDRAQTSSSDEKLRRLRGRPPLTQERYQFEEEVGRGGMGAVLRVRDLDLQRNLAMKVILGQAGSSATDNTPPVDPQVLQRFLDEAQITGQLDHPGVVPVHELGVDDKQRVYFTMRLVKGDTADAVFARARSNEGGWTQTRAIEVILKVCDTMAFAHKKGVLHRDLKPSNVMVGSFGEVYVMDWGLAKVLGETDRRDIRLRSMSTISKVRTDRSKDEADSDSPLLTMDGDVVGTPCYMAPEQAEGRVETLDQRADVYAIGAMLYQLLTGRQPYVSPGARVSPYVILAAVQAGPPTPVHKLDKTVPAELAAVCERAMARNLAHRYPDVRSLADDLRAYLEKRVVKAYSTGALAEMKSWVRRNRASTAAASLALLLLVGVPIAYAAQESASSSRIAGVLVEREEALAAHRTEQGVKDRILADVGHFLIDSRNFDVGIPLFRRVLAIEEQARGHEHPGLSRTLLMLGDLLRGKREYAEARSHYERGLRLAEATGSEINTRDFFTRLGYVEGALGRYEPAMAYLEKALAISARDGGEESPDALADLSNLANLHRDFGRFQDGMSRYKQLRALLERVPGSRFATFEVLADQAIVMAGLGDVDGARRLAEENIDSLLASIQGPLSAISIVDRKVYASLWSRCLGTLSSIDEKSPSPSEPERIHLALVGWKGILTDRLLCSRVPLQSSGSTDADRILLELQRMASQISRVALDSEIQDLMWAERLTRLCQEYRVMESQLYVELNRLRQPESASIAEVARSLPTGSVLVDYFAQEKYVWPSTDSKGNMRPGSWVGPTLAAVVLRAGDATARIASLGSVKDVQRTIREFVATADRVSRDIAARGRDPDERTPSVINRELRGLVWHPLAELVGDASIVFVSPTEALDGLALEMLGLSDQSFLLSKHSFVYVDDARTIPRVMRHPRGAANSLLSVGGIDYDAAPSPEVPGRSTPKRKPGFPQLPGSRAESQAIFDMHSGAFGDGAQRTLLQGASATKESTKHAAAGASCVHFAGTAGHAHQSSPNLPDWVDDLLRAVDTGLVCAGSNLLGTSDQDGGILTALEVRWLDFSRCQLVVLSACDTAAGGGTGTQGQMALRTAFQQAGAASVMGTLWKVEDIATKELMVAFYRHFWMEHLPKHEALRQAKLDQIRQGRMNMRDWGAFVLFGDWR